LQAAEAVANELVRGADVTVCCSAVPIRRAAIASPSCAGAGATS
jgi:hypothetical protein